MKYYKFIYFLAFVLGMSTWAQAQSTPCIDSRYGKLVNVVAHDGKLHRSRHGVVVVVIVPVPAEVVAVIACCVVDVYKRQVFSTSFAN